MARGGRGEVFRLDKSGSSLPYDWTRSGTEDRCRRPTHDTVPCTECSTRIMRRSPGAPRARPPLSHPRRGASARETEHARLRTRPPAARAHQRNAARSITHLSVGPRHSVRRTRKNQRKKREKGKSGQKARGGERIGSASGTHKPQTVETARRRVGDAVTSQHGAHTHTYTRMGEHQV